MSAVTVILSRAHQGDRQAAEQLLPLVYAELRRLAAHRMANEAEGNTLQPTALVHEAWLKLTGNDDREWNGRTHFFAAAAEAMRRILVDSARRKRAVRHGGQLQRATLDEVDLPLPMPDGELLELNEALDRLAAFNARAAEVVKLCFFVGMTQEQAARELNVSLSTVERHWAFARTFLYREVQGRTERSAS